MVVIGSSFISMELVQAVSKRRLASINVIGMEEFPFEMVLGKEVGKGLMKVLAYSSSLKLQLRP
jgi:apoptosis-inducing factor 3